MKVVASWSGGKDSAYALHLAKQQGHRIISLFTMMSSKGKSKFHMLHSELLEAQAKAIGIPLIKKQTDNDTYEQDFKAVLAELKTMGVEGLVTGDICAVAGHEEGWLDRVCKEMELKPIRPLWLMSDTKQIYLNYLEVGFRATVIRVNLCKLGIEWLGRVLDRQFYEDILKLDNIDPCGEGGEYHTVVTDGPYFKKKVKILEAEKHNIEGNFGYLEVKDFTLE
ncbi:MAG: diphthine--ammonia ligase [Candidatus Bathyarchaeota archaeon]|uniref:Dph6-related ATP pyrophosphatase n=1 Tax=Candidatus Bathycorpusculum sp. TaxID=2994959 RepID=UPI00281B9AA6|nr:diphthine--ammonia ligase [Candidatus Termiticorpusculum sp.]MCL2256592.1 diphthine--ammonia ligase [Candidatus Termiticorpusculum sp.]MCL2293214.1 diphthine--ammonia ligase [Candidatus Termiticorpusculum sp.]